MQAEIKINIKCGFISFQHCILKQKDKARFKSEIENVNLYPPPAPAPVPSLAVLDSATKGEGRHTQSICLFSGFVLFTVHISCSM